MKRRTGQRSESREKEPELRGPAVLRSGLVSHIENATSLEDLEPEEVIGEGMYGVVHKMREKVTGQLRVVKTVERPTGWDDQQLKMEAQILQNLDHPHILRIFSWYEDGHAVNIVLEHCEGGELMKVVKMGRDNGQHLPELWASTALRQTFEALVYIHSKGVIHKDLKSANLLLLQSTELQGKFFLSAPHIVVCDLGLAEICSRGIFGMNFGAKRGRRVAGTPVTMAPEVWKGSFGAKCDIWSMGCVMFELFTDQLPFRPSANREDLWFEQYRKGPDWTQFVSSHQALRLNERLLTVKESLRPSATDCLQDEWIRMSANRKLPQQEVDGLVNAVRQWVKRNAAQRAMSLKMAAGCTCLKRFSSLFSQFDTDNSGILDSGEILPAFESLGMSKAAAKEVAHALDINGDGSCEYIEFAGACLSSLDEQFDELLRQEFNVLDTQRRGWLSDEQMAPLIEELKVLAESHGLTLGDLDENGDGVISFSEFCEYFGRAGVKYEDDVDRDSVATRQKPVTQLPMKQQIRLISGQNKALQSFKESMEASIDKRSFSQTMSKDIEEKTVDAIVAMMERHEKAAKPIAKKKAVAAKTKPAKAAGSAKAPAATAQGASKEPVEASANRPATTADGTNSAPVAKAASSARASKPRRKSSKEFPGFEGRRPSNPSASATGPQEAPGKPLEKEAADPKAVVAAKTSQGEKGKSPNASEATRAPDQSGPAPDQSNNGDCSGLSFSGGLIQPECSKKVVMVMDTLQHEAKALLELSKDTELTVSMLNSHSASGEHKTCNGCWLTETAVNWFGVECVRVDSAKSRSAPAVNVHAVPACRIKSVSVDSLGLTSL